MNNAQRRLRPALALLTAATALLAGCVYSGPSDRTVYDIGGRSITVIDYPDPASYADVAPQSLIRIDDARGMDWLSEEEIVIGRPNSDFPAERARGTPDYPQNLYALTIADRRLTPLMPENAYQGYAQASPDRTMLLYKTFDPKARTGQGYILDLSSLAAIAFTAQDGMDVRDGRWADNETIVYAASDGAVHVAFANGSQTKVLWKQSPIAPDAKPYAAETAVAFADGRIFVTTENGQLSVLSTQGNPHTLAARNIISVTPAPGGGQLAVVHTVAGGDMELVIADLEGNPLLSVARHPQIYGTAWSPDGRRLAYAAIAANGTVSSVQVADAATGMSAPLPVDIRFISDPLRWSPSGSRLMIPAARSDEAQSRSLFTTFLVHVP